MKIHVQPSSPQAFFVNAFILEGETSLIVVDTHFLVSSANALCARVEALGKPIAGIVITHPHPDHFNGLPQLRALAPDAPVFATQATHDGIRDTQAAKRSTWEPVYGDEYPKQDALPTEILPSEARLTLGGMTLEVTDLGPAECLDNTVVHLPDAKALIVSDLVYNECHPWLAEMRSALWLDRLNDIGKRFASVAKVYAGHGPAGEIDLLARQANYIKAFRDCVGRHLTSGLSHGLDDAALNAILAETIAGRSGWPLESLIGLNSQAIAKELAAG
jgi:glyoxylase-like metal-dependent hydrolase (beta-lactamase superfamily II)